ncbi:MAG TPA: quinolinate synthase NadA [Nitrospiria bacterium]|nr:quinolinate synthase NadA [Nitrospiria bacterium]
MSSIDLKGKIERLKKERGAIILAHNYQEGEIQDIADFVGDSLALSKTAAKTDAKVIVFCGVHFMAETAAILSPEKKVIMPDLNAGCPMADMITPDKLRMLKEQHRQAVVVCYVNTTAEVKAESDICCTSANAAKVVGSIPADREIIFVPDKYLGGYISKKTGREMILYNGFCPTHLRIIGEDIKRLKDEHPDAIVIVHPESSPEVAGLADLILGTEGICHEVGLSQAREFIIGTETGIIHRLKKENPDKIFYPVSEKAVCANMKRNSLEKVLWALEDMENIVTVPDDIAKKAKRAIERMMEVS